MLNDMNLAREIVKQSLTTDAIAGGSRIEALTLPNGQVIRQNELTFTCYWDELGRVTRVDEYTVTEIKKFSDGRPPVIAVRRVDSPNDVQLMNNPPWIIQDWWPHVGGSARGYVEARARAMQHTPTTP